MKQNKDLKDLKSMLFNTSDLTNKLNEIEFEQQVIFHQNLQVLFRDFEQNISLISRMNKLITAAIQIGQSIVLDDALKNTIEFCCEILQCDRVLPILRRPRFSSWTS